MANIKWSGRWGWDVRIARMHSLCAALTIGAGNPLDFMAPVQVEDASDASSNALDEPKAKKGRQNTGTKYKDEHLEIFSIKGFIWPPNFDEFPEIDYSGMSPRIAEQVWYMHKVYGMTARSRKCGSVQFMDANYSIKRNLAWGQKSDAAMVRDPWKDLVPNITTRSTIVMRILMQESTDIQVVKVVTGHELMLLSPHMA